MQMVKDPCSFSNFGKKNEKVRVKLKNSQVSKWKSVAKNMTGTILKKKKKKMKNFSDKELPHELFVTIR